MSHICPEPNDLFLGYEVKVSDLGDVSAIFTRAHRLPLTTRTVVDGMVVVKTEIPNATVEFKSPIMLGTNTGGRKMAPAGNTDADRSLFEEARTEIRAEVLRGMSNVPA